MSSDGEPIYPPAMEIAFEGYDPSDTRRRESLFGLGNGLLLLRSSPCEAPTEDESHYPGLYRAGCYNRRDLEWNGKRLGHDSLVNLPNWLPLTFRVAGENTWFALCNHKVLAYRLTLDMGRGAIRRDAFLEDAQGRRTRLSEERLVSMARPNLAALRFELTAENWSGTLEMRSAIDGRVLNHNTDHKLLDGFRHLEVIALDARRRHASAHGTHHPVRGRDRGGDAHAAASGWRPTGVARGQEDRRLLLGGVGAASAVRRRKASRNRHRPRSRGCRSRRDRACGPGRGTRLRGFAPRAGTRLGAALAACHDHRRATGTHPRRHAACLPAAADHLAHSVQVDVGLPSRGWQEAYHGQVFWDEIFAFPFLNHRFPEIARALLMHRFRRLPAARRAARDAGYHGAMYPWRSATTGEEETPLYQLNPMSGHWLSDATRLQRHIGAAIAHNVWRYVCATGDGSFLAEFGAEMLIEIARFWASIATYDARDDRYDIRGVIGPDEYHNAYPGASAPGIDNNAYTNVMGAVSLRHAEWALGALAPARCEELTEALAVAAEERAAWKRIASRLRLCFHDDGVIAQFAGFDRLQPFDSRAFTEQHPDGRVDWTLEAKGDTVDAYQVTKQADLLMLFYLMTPGELLARIRDMGYAVEPDALRATLTHYLDRVTHESSLSHVVCAGALARYDPAASWHFFGRSLSIDLDAANGASAEEGLHLGSMSGTFDVLQRHYLGLRCEPDALVLAPAPPKALGPVQMLLLPPRRHCHARLGW